MRRKGRKMRIRGRREERGRGIGKKMRRRGGLGG